MADLLRRVELSELRAFCVAVELGSLGRAARLLRVSQPALSKRMRELEALAGANLLERSTRGVSPTPAGERLYAETQPLLTQAERVEELLGGLGGEQAPIRLAAGHTIAECLLPGPLAAYRAGLGRHLALELVVANSTTVQELVAEGRADFGLAAVDPQETHDRGLRRTELCEDEVVVAVPPEHPWTARASIPLKEFAATRMVMRDPSANTRRIVDAALGERGLELAPPLAEVGSTGAAIEAAVAGGAPALLSRLAVLRSDGQLLPRRVRELRFSRSFVLVWGSRRALGREARALISHLTTTLLTDGTAGS